MGKPKLNNEKGFSAAEVILVLAILVSVGVVGFMVYKNYNKTSKSGAATITDTSTTAPTQPTTKTTAPTSTPTQPTSTSTEIKSADGKVAITLPTGYKMTNRTDGGNFCSFGPSAPAPGTCISFISYQKGSDATVGGYVKIFKTTESASAWHNATFGDCGSPQDKTINGDPELICTTNPDGGHDYTISNGQYVAYFTSDSSAQSLTVISSVQFL